MKAVPQPQLRARQGTPVVPTAPISGFVGGENEWLTLNSDLPRLTRLKTVADLEEGFTQRLLRTRDFIYYLGTTRLDWRILNVYLHYCDEKGGFLPDRTIDQNGRIKRQGRGIWAGLRGKKDSNKKDDTNLVGHFLTRETRRETADDTIATYLGMTQEEKERELRRILISMDLILDYAEKNKCWRAAATYLKMVDYDGSFLPMSSAARDRWEKSYAHQVDKWEQVEKRRAEKARRAEQAQKTTQAEKNQTVPKPERTIPVVPETVPVKSSIPPKEVEIQENKSKVVDNQKIISNPSRPAKEVVVDTGEVKVVLPVGKSLVERAEAEAAARARQAHQDKLNAAIPGRKFRGQKKRKPSALTPGVLSAKSNPKGQAKGKCSGRQPGFGNMTELNLGCKGNQRKSLDNHRDNSEIENKSDKKPP